MVKRIWFLLLVSCCVLKVHSTQPTISQLYQTLDSLIARSNSIVAEKENHIKCSLKDFRVYA